MKVCVCLCCVLSIMKLLVSQLCPTLCNPMDCSPPGSSVHGILQAQTLEWFAMSSSRGSFQPRDQTLVSCTAGRFFTIWATRKAYDRRTSCFLETFVPIRSPDLGRSQVSHILSSVLVLSAAASKFLFNESICFSINTCKFPTSYLSQPKKAQQ